MAQDTSPRTRFRTSQRTNHLRGGNQVNAFPCGPHIKVSAFKRRILSCVLITVDHNPVITVLITWLITVSLPGHNQTVLSGGQASSQARVADTRDSGLGQGRAGQPAARPLSPQPSYLVPQQGRDAGFRGVADGCEIVATLQRQDDPATGQAHQLLRQVPKTCKGHGRGKWRARPCRRTDAWQWIKAPRGASHRLTEALGLALQARHLMEARLGCDKFIGGFRLGILFDLRGSRNYGFRALIL